MAIPVGPAVAVQVDDPQDPMADGAFRGEDLRGRDAFVLYQKLCAATGQRQDPCVLDTFMAATDFMSGAPAAPWWHYTPQRKALFGQV